MRRFIPFLVVALLVAMVLPGAVAAKRPAAAAVMTPVTNPVFDAATGLPAGTFHGVLTITRFVVDNGQVVAVGSVTGAVTNLLGVVGDTITQAVTLPIIAARCPILHLELGPLDLNLLGLVVHLDRVVLDISAVPGPGNLLGNLLCAVAGLLDRGGALGLIANLLNQILAILRTL